MSKPTRRVPKPRRSSPRVDSWENLYTGIGLAGIDKRSGARFRLDVLDQQTAEDIWRGDDIAARVVETLPDEMCRAGFDVQIEGDKELAEALEAEADRIGLLEAIRRGLQFGRAFGGGGLLLGVDDGARDLRAPLNENTIRSFDWVSLYSPQELVPYQYYADPLKPRYGDVAVYQLVPQASVPGTPAPAMPLIHESRILRFPGVQTTRRARFNGSQPGWDDSALNRVIRVINDFQTAWDGAAIILNDFAPPVLKLKGLAKLLASEKGTGDGIATRARALERSRSIARTTLIDSEEEYKRETVAIAGLADVLEKMALRMAAAAEMPVTLLMGQAPAGLNATGASDIRWFYDRVQAQQERVLRPALRYAIRLIMLSRAGPAKGQEPDTWDLIFRPLWQQTDKEIADTRKVTADTDVAYINAQVVTPEEIAKSRFGGDSYSSETEIDLAARDAITAEDRLAPPAAVPVSEEEQPEESEVEE